MDAEEENAQAPPRRGQRQAVRGREVGTTAERWHPDHLQETLAAHLRNAKHGPPVSYLSSLEPLGRSLWFEEAVEASSCDFVDLWNSSSRKEQLYGADEESRARERSARGTAPGER